MNRASGSTSRILASTLLYLPLMLLASSCTYRSCYLHPVVLTAHVTCILLYLPLMLLASRCTYRSCYLHPVVLTAHVTCIVLRLCSLQYQCPSLQENRAYSLPTPAPKRSTCPSGSTYLSTQAIWSTWDMSGVESTVTEKYFADFSSFTL